MLSTFYSILMVQNHSKESSSNCNRLTGTSKIITADSSCLECCASQEQTMFIVWNVHQTQCLILRHERCLVTTVFAPGVPRTLPDRMVWHHSWMCVHLLGSSDHLNQGYNIQTESCQWFHRMWMHCSLVCFLFAVPCWGSDIRLLIITLVNCPSNVQKQLHSLLSLRWFARLFCLFIWLITCIHWVNENNCGKEKSHWIDIPLSVSIWIY